MLLEDIRHKLTQVISNGKPETMRLATRDSIYIISLAWCGLPDEQKRIFEEHLERDYKLLKSADRISL